MSQAAVLARDLLDMLRPVCEQVEIAGSVRRQKPDPKDIELVCIPITVPVMNLFADGEVGRYDMNRWVRDLVGWELDRKQPRNGPRWKRLVNPRSLMCCDLFITRPEAWGVMFTLRTGPADFSTQLMIRCKARGLKVEDGLLYKTHRDGKTDLLATPTERSFFEALGLPWLEPVERSVAALRAHA